MKKCKNVLDKNAYLYAILHKETTSYHYYHTPKYANVIKSLCQSADSQLDSFEICVIILKQE